MRQTEIENTASMQKGDVLLDRFHLEKRIVRGSYGQVFKAFDRADRTRVAVKILLGTEDALERNMVEAKILDMLKNKQTPYSGLVVQMKECFYSADRVVIVLEFLKHNLKKSIKDGKFSDFFKLSVHAKQMIQFLDYMSGMKIIHGDIKPENIFVEKRNRIKFANFELAHSPFTGPKAPIIQSLHYKAPEVLLGYDYEQPADTWSVGCVLVECLLGFPAFDADDEFSLMQWIIEIIGMPSQAFVALAPNRDRFYAYSKKFDQWLFRGFATLPRSTGLKNLMDRHFGGDTDRREYLSFVNLVEGMLKVHPSQRATPEDCMKHPFLQRSVRRSNKKREADSAHQEFLNFPITKRNSAKKCKMTGDEN